MTEMTLSGADADDEHRGAGEADTVHELVGLCDGDDRLAWNELDESGYEWT